MDLEMSRQLADQYRVLFLEFIKSIKDIGFDISKRDLEFKFESLSDWNLLNTFDEAERWYMSKLEKEDMNVQEIPLSDCRDWIVDNGRIYHKTNEFFCHQYRN